VNKTNSCIEFQFHWYYDSTCFGQSLCPSSGVLNRTSALVQFMQFGDRALPGAGSASVSTLLPNCINCTNADVRLRTPDDGHKDCPKHVESYKIETQCICWFYSQGIYHDERSYSLKISLITFLVS
jgi:hypothetical protein